MTLDDEFGTVQPAPGPHTVYHHGKALPTQTPGFGPWIKNQGTEPTFTGEFLTYTQMDHKTSWDNSTSATILAWGKSWTDGDIIAYSLPKDHPFYQHHPAQPKPTTIDSVLQDNPLFGMFG